MTNPVAAETEPTAALKMSAEAAELALYRAAFEKAEAVCNEVAKGNLEARIIGIDESGASAGMLHAINRMLDLTDAFVREAGASLTHASEGKYYRSFMERGMLGDFRRGAAIINRAREDMEQKAREAAAAEAEAEQQREREREQAEINKQRLQIAEDFGAKVAAAVETVASAARQMEATAKEMTALTENAHEQSLAVAAAAQEATTNVQTVAAATQELSSSINEISQQVSESAAATNTAVEGMNSVNSAVGGLTEMAEQIDKVVEFIRSIASKTNLLALNATIEAARAGEAGKGFAVVASEVKTLAQQTATATNDITAQIRGIQDASTQTAQATASIGKSIDHVSGIATAIASAIEEQSAATGEISGNVQQAAEGTRQVTGKIEGISGAAEQTGMSAKDVLGSASDLAAQAAQLSGEVEKFLEDFRAA